jgi:hypothetical protein
MCTNPARIVLELKRSTDVNAMNTSLLLVLLSSLCSSVAGLRTHGMILARAKRLFEARPCWFIAKCVGSADGSGCGAQAQRKSSTAEKYRDHQIDWGIYAFSYVY